MFVQYISKVIVTQSMKNNAKDIKIDGSKRCLRPLMSNFIIVNHPFFYLCKKYCINQKSKNIFLNIISLFIVFVNDFAYGFLSRFFFSEFPK